MKTHLVLLSSSKTENTLLGLSYYVCVNRIEQVM